MQSNSSGFTLVEVLVALAVGSVVVLGAHGVFQTLIDHTDRTVATAMTADEDANGERLLRSLIGRIHMAGPGMFSVVGNEREVRFGTWCDTPSGWQERCNAVITVRPAEPPNAGVLITAILSPTDTVPLKTGMLVARLRYLEDASNGGRWNSAWQRRPDLPLAIGIVTNVDTLLVRIGERG